MIQWKGIASGAIRGTSPTAHTEFLLIIVPPSGGV